MKLLLALALLASFSVFANEAKKEEAAVAPVAAKVEAKKEEKKMDKKAAKEAQKAAKEACLAENKDLKGKELKECIVKKQKEAK